MIIKSLAYINCIEHMVKASAILTHLHELVFVKTV